MTTFEIKSEMFALQELIDQPDIDMETGEVLDNSEALQALIDEIEEAKGDKADSIIYLAKEYEMRAKAVQEEIKRMQERKAMFARKVDKLKNLLDYLLGGEKIKTDHFTVFYAKSESTEIDDEGAIPETYWSFTPKLDKTAIKKAIKEGREIPGAHLLEKISVRWR